MNLLSQARHAVQDWLRRPGLLAISLLADLVFFLMYGFVSQPVKDKIVEHVIIIGSIMSQHAQETGYRAVQAGQSVVALLAQVPGVGHYLTNLVGLFVLLSLGSYVTYVLFQGGAWLVAHRVLGDTLSWQEFIARFALLNIWWGVAFFIYSALTLLLQMRIALINALSPSPQTNVLGAALTVTGVFLGILAAWTYARPLQKRSARGLVRAVQRTVQGWTRTVPATLFVALVFVGVHYAIVGISSFNQTLAFIAGVVLVFPAFAWSRLFMIRVMKHGMDA